MDKTTITWACTKGEISFLIILRTFSRKMSFTLYITLQHEGYIIFPSRPTVMDISIDSVLIISDSGDDEYDDNWSPPDASVCVPPPPPPTPSSTVPFILQLTPPDGPPLVPTGKHHEQPHLDVIKYQSSAEGEDNDTRLLNR